MLYERFSLKARFPAGVQENEPALKRKSIKQVFKLKVQEMEYTFR